MVQQLLPAGYRRGPCASRVALSQTNMRDKILTRVSGCTGLSRFGARASVQIGEAMYASQMATTVSPSYAAEVSVPTVPVHGDGNNRDFSRDEHGIAPSEPRTDVGRFFTRGLVRTQTVRSQVCCALCVRYAP